MKEFSTTLPKITVPQYDGTMRFNYNVKEFDDGYTYDSIDVAGEFTRDNICYAFLLEHYESQEIDELVSYLCNSDKTIDKLRWSAYQALKAEINGWIDLLLGVSFE